MKLNVEELPGGVTKAVLDGRMDIDGAAKVDTQFNVLAGSKQALVVDLANVSFIASMGLRTLMTCARAMKNRGARMALANPQDNVMKVLATSGVGEIIPVHPSIDAAIAAVSA